MKCARCQQEGRPLTHYIHAETQEHTSICMDCLAREQIDRVSEVSEIDEQLAEYEALSKDYESMILKMSDFPAVPGGFTPMSIYEGIQHAIAHLKKQRMHLMREKDKTQRLQQQLADALKAEDYQQAQSIQDELDQEE
jgi:protein-arginine kinase activator protein McsA